jgi:hypothetical protein
LLLAYSADGAVVLDYDNRCKGLLQLLAGDIVRIERSLAIHRYRMLSVKLSSIVLAGAITVLLLGFTPKRSRQAIPVCVALMIGGAITIFSARDLYLRERLSGIRHRIKTMRLRQVKSALDSLMTSEDGAIRAKLLDALFVRRQQILED